jgi:hypothetical protein
VNRKPAWLGLSRLVRSSTYWLTPIRAPVRRAERFRVGPVNRSQKNQRRRQSTLIGVPLDALDLSCTLVRIRLVTLSPMWALRPPSTDRRPGLDGRIHHRCYLVVSMGKPVWEGLLRLLIAMAFGHLASAPAAAQVNQMPATVERVVDGDTVDLLLENGRTERIRLIGVRLIRLIAAGSASMGRPAR